ETARAEQRETIASHERVRPQPGYGERTAIGKAPRHLHQIVGECADAFADLHERGALQRWRIVQNEFADGRAGTQGSARFHSQDAAEGAVASEEGIVRN